MKGRYGSSCVGAARAAPHALRVVRDRRAHGVMVDAEGRGDGADLPVLAVIEAANLGVLLGRDHGAPPGTRDGSARAVEGARRFPGHRPCNATRPPGARSAPDPSTCPRAVWRAAPARGKSDPSRGRDTRAGDRDDRGGLPDCADGAGARRGPTRGAPPCDTPASNTRGRDHTRRRSRRGGCSADRFSGEAACPRRRSGGALRLDTARQTVAQERRLARSVGASRRSPRVWRFSSRPSPRPAAARQPTAIHVIRGGARRQLLPSVGVIATAAERLQGSSMTADFRTTQSEELSTSSPDLRGFR